MGSWFFCKADPTKCVLSVWMPRAPGREAYRVPEDEFIVTGTSNAVVNTVLTGLQCDSDGYKKERLSEIVFNLRLEGNPVR